MESGGMKTKMMITILKFILDVLYSCSGRAYLPEQG